MYIKLKSCVKQDNNLSEKFSVNKGTRQGCSMSPTLFKLYLSDLHNCCLSDECHPIKIGANKLGCLLYADDVVILSQDASGLQASLNNLDKYCKQWRLQINMQKTKIMVFNSRKNLHIFKIGNNILQQTDRTCYLGFILTLSGKFNSTVKYLYNKACKAFFLLKAKYKILPNLSIQTQVKLFDTMIVPILLYGSEVWGAYLTTPNNFLNFMANCQHLIEKLHSKFCKYTLGLHKNSNNYGVRLELGRFPLLTNIICRVLKYYVNILKHKNESVVKIALEQHKCMDKSWYTFVKYIVELCGMSLEDLTKNNIKSTVLTKIKNIVEDLFLHKIAETSRLKLYCKIKKRISSEKYLKLCDPLLRKSVTQLRISMHNLPIETGRYDNTKQENRLCLMCNYKVGNEFHCLMECIHPTLTSLRNQYLSNIFNINPSFKYLSRNNLFQYLTCFHDTSIIEVSAQYIQSVFTIYSKLKTK